MFEKNNSCYFCQEIEDPVRNNLNRNRVVLETKNFIAMPTVGCFKIGYLLILPKAHYLCFGEFDSVLLDELNALIEKITQFVYTKYHQKCIVFEHGTRDLSQLTSTSVMHAHIHVIPFEADITSSLPDFCELKKISGFQDLKHEKNNYLFLREANGNNFIVKNQNYPSQFFRRIACKAMGIDDYWDWREYPFIENMGITLDYYYRELRRG